MSAAPTLSRKDFVSDQDVRWCPGCGDYSILANIQRVMPELNTGQLTMLLRAEYLAPARSYSKVAGQPFKVSELALAIARASRGEDFE